jgi:hypothetical protein
MLRVVGDPRFEHLDSRSRNVVVAATGVLAVNGQFPLATDAAPRPECL